MAPTKILLLTIACFAAASGQLFFRVGALGKVNFADFINVQIAIGLVLYALSTVIWIYALSSEKLVSVFAFTALTFVLVYAGGALLLGEKMTLTAIGGVLLVLSGLYLITVHGS